MKDPADLFRAPPHRFVDVEGAQVAVRSVGRGPDVLFVHGWPVSGATFRCLLPHLAEHVRCHVIDLAGAGDSRFDARSPLSIRHHIQSVRAVVDALGASSLAVVGHDSGGMIARHAMAGDRRLRALGLINTEQPQGLNWRFRLFLSGRVLPGFGAMLGWVAGRPKLRRNKFVLGDAFADRSLLDGEFDEFFLSPLHQDADKRAAAIRLLKSFRVADVEQLAALHAGFDVPVQLVWGAQDPFFPVERAREMVETFPQAQLHVVDDAGLFSHEERPEAVANALLPVLAGG
ncbi:MAG: alpha/beta hydrolase [Myxococcota bacterium]